VEAGAGADHLGGLGDLEQTPGNEARQLAGPDAAVFRSPLDTNTEH
jgi:hypothetical protein